jgi:hypothetical protein
VHSSAFLRVLSELFDLDGVWHLVGLCGWFLDTISAILKECVLLDNVRKEEKTVGVVGSTPTPNQGAPRVADGNKEGEYELITLYSIQRLLRRQFGILKSGLITSSCQMLHILHPFAFSQLQAVLLHVRAFHRLLKSLYPRTESAMLARDVLVDNIDSSGINLDALDAALNEIKDEVRMFAGAWLCLRHR